MISRHFFQRSGAGATPAKKNTPTIETLSLPDTLKYFLTAGGFDEILVQEGDSVHRAQPLTRSSSYLSPPVHAGSSGTISGIDANCITITTDGLDTWSETTPIDLPVNRDGLIQVAHDAGLIGQGGAGFPLAAKLHALPSSARLLLVNAAECDPVICCDDALIQSEARAIVESIVQIAKCCDIRDICIGIEDNKPEAIQALNSIVHQQPDKSLNITIVEVAEKYPSGAESILLKQCTGIEPQEGLSVAEQGILSMNIASCYALGQALKTGHACTARVTTVASSEGDIRNFLLRLGTPVSFVATGLAIELSTELSTDPGLSPMEANSIHVSAGGHMMPESISLNDSISQTYNCISFNQCSVQNHTRPCIRCGACAEVCPVGLMPQNLHISAQHFDPLQLTRQGLNRCIECRGCDHVCPSHIPLTRQFQTAKQLVADKLEAEINAELARVRYEKRESRLKKNRRPVRRHNLSNPPAKDSAESSHQSLIAAALARSRQKKESGSQ